MKEKGSASEEAHGRWQWPGGSRTFATKNPDTCIDFFLLFFNVSLFVDATVGLDVGSHGGRRRCLSVSRVHFSFFFPFACGRSARFPFFFFSRSLLVPPVLSRAVRRQKQARRPRGPHHGGAFPDAHTTRKKKENVQDCTPQAGDMDNLPVDVAASVQAVDDDLGLGSLPPEIVEMVLRSAGPFATARAAGASRYLSQVARRVAEQEKRVTARELCSDYETCLREFLLAAAEDDADTVEYIIASGAIDPRRPLIASVAALPRPPLDPQQGDPYALLRTEPPSTEGWTPLVAAAAYGAPAVIARLASIGVRPQPQVETLINRLLRRGRKLHYSGPVVRGVTALAETYPRTSPLNLANENPLTALREYALDRAVSRARFEPNPGDFTVALFESDVLPIVQALLRAGYSPDERARALERNGPSEMDLAIKALDRSTDTLDAALSRGPFAVNAIPTIIAAYVILQRLVDAYEQRQATSRANAGPSAVANGNDAMQWEGQRWNRETRRV
ncbi:hypothetical protein [Pandoravirus japonicus]|uniref:Ankyrin repeat domain containing protein n=1 Tax=Pandoravirus japonicus TaxID=2823154 RepID=A0A811BPR8_9VIRU|nr:hypothetical protein [Pandoravirus japonicus]